MATINISKNFQEAFDGNYGYQLEDLDSFDLVNMIKDFMAKKENDGTMDDDSLYDMATIGFSMAYVALTKANNGPLMDKEFMEYAQMAIID